MNNKQTILLKESELINFLTKAAIDVNKVIKEQVSDETTSKVQSNCFTILTHLECPPERISEILATESSKSITNAAKEVLLLIQVYGGGLTRQEFKERTGYAAPSQLTGGLSGTVLKPLHTILSSFAGRCNKSYEQALQFYNSNIDADGSEILQYLGIGFSSCCGATCDVLTGLSWYIYDGSQFPDNIIAGEAEAEREADVQRAELEREEHVLAVEKKEQEETEQKAKDDFYMETWLSLPFDLPNPFKEILRHLWEMSSDWTVTIQEAATWLWDNAKKVWKWFTEDGYHIVLDIISFLGFIMCGTLLPGLGCVISVVADIVNAILYIWDKEDYFMAGLQLSMAMIPGAEAVKHYFKPLGKLLNPIFKAMFKTLQSGKALTKTAIQVEMKALAKVIGDELSLLKELIPKSLLTKIKPLINQIDEFIGGMNLKAYFPFIGDVVDDVFKKAWAIAGGFLRALIWIGEAVWYDPEYTGSLIKMFGDWTGIETFVDWGEAMEDWPKYGVKVANNTYSFFGIGGIKALVQTSIADCNNTVFTWEHVKEDYIAQHNLTENNFDEKELEKAWWNGWRPNPMMSGRSGPRKMPLTSDTEAMEAVRNEYAIWVHYAAMHACTDEKFQDKWEIDKMTCAQFEVFYEELKNKTVKKLLGKTDDYAGVEIEMGAQADLFFDFQLICGEPEEPEEEEDWEVELPAPD